MDIYERFIEFCEDEDELVNLAEDALTIRYNKDGNNRSGHLKQAFFAVYHFFSENRGEIVLVPQIDERYDLQNSPLFKKWLQFLNEHEGDYGPYSFESIKNALPQSLGGDLEGGGGWGPPLKIVFPLVAKFIR